ncbi:MAG: indolepyruvate oxidoreductase subunit beta [Firmicutes bacterium]|nr:indolepyruvate oxidoreductase subunit beta [Bacillota bacterium]
MKENINIMIVGVGGQGSLLASKLLGRIFLDNDYDVKVSEVHGMSQRGGSVLTYVRVGEKVYSPIIDEGEADYVISFEILEAARAMDYLKPTGKIITNIQEINPMPVVAGKAEYPKDLAKRIKDSGVDIDAFDALKIAEEAGSPKAVNLVLMGRLSKHFDFTEEEWIKTIEKSVPPKFLEMNKKAFYLGRNS